ncbi:MAG: dethiobiotin synthase, partial [Planctomycetota bacterium]|nr:dethiobiotin synthase [Planctomycetota bacterium]
MPRLYVSATQQHDGKTTVSLGLYSLFRERGKRVHFIKPVGQRYLEQDGHKADEDAVLFQRLFDKEISLPAMSPVAVPRGFTEHYIFNRDRAAIYAEIDKAIATVERDTDIVLVEGTGHAGVGSVFDASNADVAKHLQASALIISQGGIGRCIDEICLNRALFERAGVPLLGAVINKVLPQKYDKIDRAVRQ